MREREFLSDVIGQMVCEGEGERRNGGRTMEEACQRLTGCPAEDYLINYGLE